jgi:hypothetical protein
MGSSLDGNVGKAAASHGKNKRRPFRLRAGRAGQIDPAGEKANSPFLDQIERD